MFTKKPEITKMQLIEERSKSAISIFEDTLNILTEIEIEADQVIKAKKEAIELINDDIATIEARQKINNKFINKLNEFF